MTTGHTPTDDESRARFQRADALFDAALDRPAVARTAFVRTASGDDAMLFADVMTLLRAHDGLGDYLATPVTIDVTAARLQAAAGNAYTLRSLIATGGMAHVYLADDVRHARRVAIKVFTFDVAAASGDVGAARFLDEIRVTARLQHPNIVPLFDSAVADGLFYFVMPFVDGETLRQRMRRERMMPLDEALQLVHALASALEHAHANGVVHRDLKPENILLRDGQPLIADFGIALALAGAGAALRTRTGTVLGTPQYMSPEQAAGERTIDARSDEYALAAILYEMLTGDAPHQSSSALGILAKVMSEIPTPVHRMRAAIPHAISDVIDRALAKHSTDRYASVREFNEALQEARRIPAAAVPVTAAPVHRWPSKGAAIGVLSLLAIGAVAVFWSRRDDAVREPSSQFVVAPSADAAIGRAPSLSPDGSTLVYSGSAATGRKVFVRKVSELQAHALPGTDGALNTMVSPDGAWIAYTTSGDKLLKVPLDGGATTTITGVFRYSSAAWAGNTRLVLDGYGQEGLTWVASSGGERHALTRLDTRRRESSHRSVLVLADTRTVVFTIGAGRSGPGPVTGELGVVTLDTTATTPATTTRIGVQARSPVGYVDGWLLYVTQDGKRVNAVRFDVSTHTVSGAAVSVLEHDAGKIEIVRMAKNGTLLYTRQVSAEANAPLLVELDGSATPLLGSVTGSFMSPRFSPDGSSVMLQSTSPKGNDLVVYDLRTRTPLQVTTNGSAVGGTWTPDGRGAAYFSSEDGRDAIWLRAIDGMSPAEKLTNAQGAMAPDVSHDGSQLVIQRIIDGTWGIWRASMTGDRAPAPVVVESYDAFMPALSPDGQWVAYAANPSGRYQIYVRPFPGGGNATQVSEDGGTEPAWSGDGRTIYFRDGQRMLSARVRLTGSARAILARRVLFTDTFDGDMPMPHRNYDVTADGKRFVMIGAAGGSPETIVVLNWRTDFRARIAAASR